MPSFLKEVAARLRHLQGGEARFWNSRGGRNKDSTVKDEKERCKDCVYWVAQCCYVNQSPEMCSYHTPKEIQPQDNDRVPYRG